MEKYLAREAEAVARDEKHVPRSSKPADETNASARRWKSAAMLEPVPCQKGLGCCLINILRSTSASSFGKVVLGDIEIELTEKRPRSTWHVGDIILNFSWPLGWTRTGSCADATMELRGVYAQNRAGLWF